jgi:hypothetical protein
MYIIDEVLREGGRQKRFMEYEDINYRQMSILMLQNSAYMTTYKTRYELAKLEWQWAIQLSGTTPTKNQGYG